MSNKLMIACILGVVGGILLRVAKCEHPAPALIAMVMLCVAGYVLGREQ